MSQLPDLMPGDVNMLAPHRGQGTGLPDLMPPDDGDAGKAKAVSNLRMLPDVAPDQAAQDAALGRQLDMPPDMVGMDRAAAKRQRIEQAIYQIDAGPLQDWLGDPYHVSISADDLRELGILNDTLTPKDAWDNFTNFGRRALHGTNESLNASSRNAGRDYQYGVAQQKLSERAYEAIKTPALIPGVLEEQKRIGDQRRTDGFLDTYLLRPLFQTGLPFVVEGTKAGGYGAMIGAGSAIIAGQMGPQIALPEEVVTVPMAAAAGAAMSSSEWMMRQEAGGAFLEFLQERDAEGNPLDPQVAALSAVAVGVLNAGLELTGAGAMVKAYAPLARMLTREGLRAAVRAPGYAAAAREFLGQCGKAAGTEISTEMAQEFITIMGGRAAQNVNAAMRGVETGNPDWLSTVPGRLAETGVETLGAFGLIMLPGPLAGFRANLRAASRGEAHHRVMSRAIDAGEQSKTRTRDADAYEKLAANALPEEMQRQYVDAETLQTFFQSAAIEDAAEKLGINEMEFAHAVETGGVVGMDTAKFLSHLTPDQQRQLLPDLKAGPLALSQREAASRDFAAEARELVTSYARDMERAEEFARERSRLLDELIATGRDKAWAEAETEAVMAYAASKEKTYGRDVFDGVERLRRITIQRGEDGDALPEKNSTLYQFDNEGNAVSPGETNPKIARVVGINPAGIPVDLKDTKSLATWLRDQYQGMAVTITDDGTIQQFTGRNLDASTKRRGEKQRQMYSGLAELVRNAVYDGFEEADERHAGKVAGQNVYFSAANIDGKHYAVRIKVDMPARESGKAAYKDHKISEIQIAPSLYRGRSQVNGSTQAESAIRGISVAILKGDVNPSRIENGVLYQSAFHGNPKDPRILYQQKEAAARGAVRFTEAQDIITLFKGQDASTVMHEAGHIFLRDLERMASATDAPAALARDWAITREYLGLAEGEALTEDAHEKFARSFEKYLSEGHSPSFELTRVFHNFRTWLTSMYNYVRNLGVELTPEIRGVFDRMLATDEQLAETAAISRMAEEEGKRLDALRQEALEGISDADMADLNRALEDAHRNATNEMDRATLRDFHKRRRDALVEATAAVDNDPVYAAAKTLRKNPDKEFRGISYDHIAENYSRAAADAIRRKFPGVVNKDGGLGADVVCNDVGFESGDALIYALADAEPRGKRIADLAEQIMREHDEALMPDQAVAASESYGRYLEKLHAALAKTMRAVTWSPRQYLRYAAEQYTRAMPVREAIRYDTHQHTMEKQMEARKKATAAGNARGELAALEKFRLAHEMAGEAVRAKERIADLAKRISRIVKSKSMESQFRDQVLSLADRFGIGTGQKPRNPEHMVPLATLLQGQVDDYGWAVSFPDWLVGGTVRTDYRDLTLFEFGQLDDLVRHLEKRGRDEHRESKASYVARIGNLTRACVEPSAKMKPKPVFSENSGWRKLTDASRSFFASTDSLQFLFRSFDGYSNVGPDGTKGANERLLWEPIIEGSNARKRLIKEIKTALEPHLTRLRASARAWEKQHGKRLLLPGVVIPESFKRIGRGWSSDAVITMALHMGSESNMARLRSGYPDLNSPTIEILTGLLGEKDWDAVQGVWDTLDAQWGKLDEVHYKINGFHMQRIPAREFVPVGLERKGIIKKLRGGYFPAIYDPAQSQFMRQVGEADSLFAQTEAMHQNPAVKKGMTQTRKDRAPGLPLHLSTSVITKHVGDVATYITLAMPVREADRVTRDPAYEAAFTRVLGREAYDSIRSNLKGIVRPETAGTGFFDQLVEKARPYATAYYLAWNFKTMLSQFLSAPRGMHDIGVKNYARGLKLSLMNNPVEKIRWIMDVSPFMEERAISRDRELAQMLNRMDVNTKSLGVFGKDWTWESVVSSGFMPMITTDWMTVYPIWLGKYEAELEKNGGDQQAAILAADEAVRFSQGTANAEDMSDFLRSGKGFKRFVSMFGTDNIGRYGQRQRYHYRAWRAGQMTAMDYAWFNVCEAILPAVGMRILLELFWRSQPLPDADDDKRWLDFLGDIFGDIFLQGVPMIGNLFSSFRKPLDSPLGSLADKGAKAAKAVGKLAADMDDEDAREKAALGIVEMLSIYGRVPASQIINRAMRGDRQYEEGDGATPFVYVIPEPKK